MVLKYDVDIPNEDIIKNINRITNQIFKLLPSREEGGEWEAPLQNLIIEIAGMNSLFCGKADLFPLLCKMEALLTLTKEEDFFLFRKTIFECLGLINGIKECLD